jgi:hypothetical protein
VSGFSVTFQNNSLGWVAAYGFINAFQPGRHIPQGLKPACLLAMGGTAEAVPFPKTIYETSSKTLAESEGARSGPREPRKAPPPFLPIQTKKERGLIPS